MGRQVREDPPIEDKIAALPNEGELTGFAGRLQADGRMTPRLENLIEMRRHELRSKGRN
jgi:hypothetical protein